MAVQFDPSRLAPGDWALSRVWRYEARDQSINDILEPAYWPQPPVTDPGWLQLGDVMIVLAADACAMVCVRSLTPERRPIFEYFRSNPPASAGVTRKAA